MGEACYEMSIEFKDKEAAQNQIHVINTMMNSLVELNDVWQSNRGQAVAEQLNRLKRIKAWVCVPKVKIEKKDVNMNALAGSLPDLTKNYELEFKNDIELMLRDDVWHFTNWDGIKNWIKKLKGVKSCMWKSHEYDNEWHYGG